jgi:hypothetical protein
MGEHETEASVVQEILITPALAQKWLIENRNNRPLRASIVTLYAEDILHDRWQNNGETIKFSKTGELLDGQHRLAAIIKAQKPIVALVVRGLEPVSFHSIDTGMRRTAAQIVSLSGYSNSSALASAARWICKLEEGTSINRWAVTSQVILAAIQKHPLLHHFASRHSEKAIRSLMPSACHAVMTLAAEKYGQEMVDAFLDSFSSGENLKRTDPVYELRERLIANTSRVAKLGVETLVAISIKAVRAFATSKTVGVLRWSSNEEWPQL